MIDSYSFGNMVIEGKRYFRDLIIYPERIRENWWRKEGHSLCYEDIKEIVEYKPEVLVIGTGYFGAMRVPPEVVNYLQSQGIEVIIKNTKEAVSTFNKLRRVKKVVGAFHLTC